MFGKSSKSSKKNSNISRSCICRQRIPTADPRPDDLKTTCENCPRDLIDLNQKYLNLRRQREELYRLLRGAFRLVRVRVEMDKYFIQHDAYLRCLNELNGIANQRGGIRKVLLTIDIKLERFPTRCPAGLSWFVRRSGR